ncbi:putative amidophosphoribosyltransferase [Microbacterium halimionae]|uniref:Putative amidophosphoribosyltransferase n=1 Tax=Microbacterium halimionae TaxID=1526413 RepID=A0A7W3JPG6_9MICO|nr:phosphoribosyltransferase family protein [Microbacterium halimionae]MBA8816624.1 putative amidophosphoribosyltransferase [Microbacterium halimionae]NII95189.1 putative amidophosphoribosyltransferase [Microbacterium halimionae]
MAIFEIPSYVSRSLADALTLFLPVECAGCGLHDVALCQQCRDALHPHPIFQETLGGLRVCSGLAFSGVSADVIRAVKEEGKTSTLAAALAPALRRAVEEVCALSGDLPITSLIVVPIPTSRAAMRRRGFRVVEVIAKRAGLSSQRLLWSTRTTADQRDLGRHERQRNVTDSMRARSFAAARVLLIDDVVTSGATLDEAARAIRAAGGIPVGAATVAATPRWADAEHTKTLGR